MKHFSLIIMILMILSCSSSKKIINSTETEAINNLPKYLSFSRGGCYGTCPIYTIKIWADGTIDYEGKAHTKNIGKFTAELDTNKTVSFFKKLETYNWESYPDKYPIDNVDFPQWKMEFATENFVKIIGGNSRADEELIALTKDIDVIISELSFEKLK